jgi:hypothetical protein
MTAYDVYIETTCAYVSLAIYLELKSHSRNHCCPRGDIHLPASSQYLPVGIEKTLEDGYRRVDSNDFLNAISIRDKLLEPDMIDKRVRGNEMEESLIGFSTTSPVYTYAHVVSIYTSVDDGI